MYREIGVPATLPLALVKLNENGQERPCLLAATLAHPPIHMRVQAADQFTITGPRADIAIEYAQHLYDLTTPSTLTEIEIEYAIPVAMGLGSEPMLGLGIAQAMKSFNQSTGSTGSDSAEVALGVESTAPLASQFDGDTNTHGITGLALWASQAGGLLLLDLSDRTAPPLYRAEPDTEEKTAWGLVTILPRVEENLDEGKLSTMEGSRYSQLIEAAHMLDSQSENIFTEALWPAVEADDLEAFGDALSQLQGLTQQALTAAGLPSLLSQKHDTILQKMSQSGAAASGQSLTGYALYAFARGARATINMRVELRDVVEYSDGIMDATVIDSTGIRVVEKEGSMTPVGTLLDRL